MLYVKTLTYIPVSCPLLLPEKETFGLKLVKGKCKVQSRLNKFEAISLKFKLWKIG